MGEESGQSQNKNLTGHYFARNEQKTCEKGSITSQGTTNVILYITSSIPKGRLIKKRFKKIIIIKRQGNKQSHPSCCQGNQHGQINPLKFRVSATGTKERDLIKGGEPAGDLSAKPPAPFSWKSVLNWIKDGDSPPHPPFVGDGFVEAFFVSFTAAATLSSSWALALLTFSFPKSFNLILRWAEPAQDLLSFVTTPMFGDWIPAYEWVVCVCYQHTRVSASYTFI